MDDKIVFKNKEFNVVKDSTYHYENDVFKTVVVERKNKKFVIDIFKSHFEDALVGAKKIKSCGIPSPKILKIDKYNWMILRKYVEGEKVEKVLSKEEFKDEYFKSLFYLYRICRANKLNVSYLPEHYLLSEGKVYYLDYILKTKSDENDLEKEPIRLWLPTIEGRNYLEKLGFDTSNIKKEVENYWNKKILLLSIQYW